MRTITNSLLGFILLFYLTPSAYAVESNFNLAPIISLLLLPTSDKVGGVNIVSATCMNFGSCLTASYNYSNGSVTSITSYIYVKNIGDSGTVNVTVTAGDYTENKQFSIISGTQYVLNSVVPVQTNWIASSTGNNLTISASFQGVSKLTKSNTVSPSYVPPSGYVPQHWIEYVANGTPSSTLEVDLDKTGI